MASRVMGEVTGSSHREERPEAYDPISVSSETFTCRQSSLFSNIFTRKSVSTSNNGMTTRKSSTKEDLLELVRDGDKPTSSLFGPTGLWGLKDNLFSGISSKLEAALQANGSNGSGSDSPKAEALSPHPPPPPVTPQLPRKPKDRSVFGQPEMDGQAQFHKLKELSMDSLDTLDSGQSMGGSSCISVSELRSLEMHDPLKSYRPATESLGIGSDQSTSVESSEAEESAVEDENTCYSNSRCESRESVQSWVSSGSEDSHQSQAQREDYKRAKHFMQAFVRRIFESSSGITLEEKSSFGQLCRLEVGRFWFARFINEQRANNKKVNESTFYSLVQYFAIILFECAEGDDFTPAKTVMNMCFTYYYQAQASHQKQYLYQYLREQPIWRSLRFWNAAFFDAVSCERANRPTPTRRQSRGGHLDPDDVEEDMTFQENITFGQLGTFTYNMKEFGLSKDFCLEFLRKQCTIANLPREQVSLLRDNIDNMYRRPV